MQRRYATADVFTERMFGGNPLAVVWDADGLSTAQMQSIALEFNYSETTFVLPPADARHTARVRIFTPRTEVPFAGHPNVGTAFLLARQPGFETAAAAGHFLFEENAGIVRVSLTRERGLIVGAELCAPEALSQRANVPPETAAKCLSLAPHEIALRLHAPVVASVGLPFLVVELASRDALCRAKPHFAAFEAIFPLDGADSIFAYCRDEQARTPAGETVLNARMFSPLDGIIEDPATGSACAAAVALIAALEGGRTNRSWRIHQGADMGRPSLLLGRSAARDGAVAEVHIGGCCVAVFEGSFAL